MNPPPASPPPATAAGTSRAPHSPGTTRRIEESRLRSKALRDQREAAQRASGDSPSQQQPKTSSGLVATSDIQLAGPAGRKRPHSAVSGAAPTPSTTRDARAAPEEAAGALRAAPSFAKYVDYNFSAMTDTKGGFLSAEDDPWNKSMAGPPAAPGAASGGPGEKKPEHMTAEEWERLQILRRLRQQKAGPFEPGLSVLADEAAKKKCRECGSLEIDFVWDDVFGCRVCGSCKEKFPEKYSLLTKTECKDDYLLTDPELKDPELLPHLSRPNPHKSHWHDMMLFLRYQVEEYAFKQKWGSAEALDAEFERREADKKRRKEAKFKEKLLDLKRKTRTESYRRNAGKGPGAGRATKFGDAIGGSGKHVHDWGRAVENEGGLTVKTCTSCGMEVEELEF